MKKLVALAVVLICVIGFCGCSDNFRAKHWGGTMNIDLPKGEKLEVVTWKEQELWYLTRPMREGETAENWTFREKSSYGLVEGKVVFKESK